MINIVTCEYYILGNTSRSGTGTVKKGAREEQLDTVGERFAVAKPGCIRIEGAVGAADFHAIEILAPFGNHIDNPKEGVVAVNGGAGAANNFNPVNDIHVERELIAD